MDLLLLRKFEDLETKERTESSENRPQSSGVLRLNVTLACNRAEAGLSLEHSKEPTKD